MSHTAILQPDRRVPTGARRAVISSGLRHLARKMESSHPALGTPGHLRDAARELDRGNTEGAQRHLRAGINDLQPVNLYRHGITDDQGHTGARQHLTSIHRHLLNVRDVEETMHPPPRAPMPGGGPSFSPSAIEGEAATGGYKAGNQAMNAPGKPPIGRSDRAAEGPRAPSPASSKQQSYSRPGGYVLNLSAQTARLAATPAPRGRPGGPGLYHVKGLGHTDYLQQIVKALIEKRGMPPGKAYAIARGAIRRWMRGGGHVHPEVRAAAGAAEAGELARQARAHAHSWADVETAIELATLDFGGPGSGNPGQQRVPAGQAGGGRFTAGKGGGGASKHPPGHPARMHHVAQHPAASMNHAQRAHAKAALLARAHQLTMRADAIAAQIAALRAQLRSAAGTGRSSAAGAGKSAAAAAGSAKAAAAATTAAAAGKAGATSAASSRSSTSSRSTSQISAKIAQLRGQEHALRAQAHAARAQAAKL